MSFLRESLLSFGSRILLVLANLPVSMLIARRLGPEGQGIYASATTYATTVAIVGLLGIDTAHTYFLAAGRYRSAAILGNSLLVLGVLSAVLIPLFSPIIALATRGQGDELHAYLHLAAILIPIVGARYLMLSVFMARRRINQFNLVYVAGNLLMALLLAAGFWGWNAGPRWSLWAFAISQLVMLLLGGIWIVRGRLIRAGRPAFSLALLRASLSYGLRGFLATILTTFVYRLDTVLVIRWLGVAAQGHYFIAVFLAEKLTHISASVQAVLFPHVSGLTSREADRLTPRVLRHTLLWVLLAAAILFALAAPLVQVIYGRAFDLSVAPMRILLPGIAALAIAKLLSADLSGRDRRFYPTVIMTVALLINIALNLAWIRSHGIVGAAWASTLAYGGQAVLMLLYFWHVTGASPLQVLRPDREDLAAYRRLLGRLAARGKVVPTPGRSMKGQAAAPRPAGGPGGHTRGSPSSPPESPDPRPEDKERS